MFWILVPRCKHYLGGMSTHWAAFQKIVLFVAFFFCLSNCKCELSREFPGECPEPLYTLSFVWGNESDWKQERNQEAFQEWMSELQSVVNCRSRSPSVRSVQDVSFVSVALYGGCRCQTLSTNCRVTNYLTSWSLWNDTSFKGKLLYWSNRSLQPMPSLLPSEAEVGCKTIRK